MNVLEILRLHNLCLNREIGKQGSYWQDWRPTALRKESWTPWRPHIIQFKDSSGILKALARGPVIFSLLGHIAMAAEAPDGHMGDLGRLGKARNGPNGGHAGGHREERLKSNCLACL